MSPAITRAAGLIWTDRRQALALLLQAWRAAPSVALADRIVTLGDTFTDPVDPRAWVDLALTRDPALLSPLLAVALTGSTRELANRVQLLSRWPADPRIDRFLAGVCSSPPRTSSGSKPFWVQVASGLARLEDRTAYECLMRLSVEDRPEPTAPVIGALKPTETPPGAEVLRVLESLDLAIAPRTTSHDRAASLEAAVLAQPASVDLRRMLMDQLLEVGDPRGELLAIHFASEGRSPTRAERAHALRLISRHRARLLGPLDGALGSTLVFKLGFLARGSVLRARTSAVVRAIERSVGHPLWATVEHLDAAPEELLDHPVMRSLVSLGVRASELRPVATRRGLVELTVTLDLAPDDLTEELERLPRGALRSLRRLTLRGDQWALSAVQQWLERRGLSRLAQRAQP